MTIFSSTLLIWFNDDFSGFALHHQRQTGEEVQAAEVRFEGRGPDGPQQRVRRRAHHQKRLRKRNLSAGH